MLWRLEDAHGRQMSYDQITHMLIPCLMKQLDLVSPSNVD